MKLAIRLGFSQASENDEVMEQLYDALLDFCFASICHPLRSSHWNSPLVHFVARRGICPKEQRFREGPECSQTLAALIFGCRLLVFHRLSMAEYPSSGSITLYGKLESLHQAYLHDRADAPMGELLPLLAYALAIAKSTTSRSTIVWGTGSNRDILFYKGEPVSRQALQALPRSILRLTEKTLREELLLGLPIKFEDIDLEGIKDDMTTKGTGMSFVNDPRNVLALRPLQHSILVSLLNNTQTNRQLFTRVDGYNLLWHVPAIDAYLGRLQEFSRLFAVLVNITGGQPARGTELVTLRYSNSPTTLRNIYIQEGQVMIIADYFKSRGNLGKTRPIPRFLPRELGLLLANYLVRVVPLAQFLYHKKSTNPPQCLDDFLFVSLAEDTHDSSSNIGNVLQKETLRSWGWSAGLLAWRQIAISWNRRIRLRDTTLDNDIEEDSDGSMEDLNDIQAGHTSHIAHAHYGVRADTLHEITPELIAQFKAISVSWHELLGFNVALSSSPSLPNNTSQEVFSGFANESRSQDVMPIPSK